MRFRSFALSALFLAGGIVTAPAQQSASARGPGSKDIIVTLRNAGNFTMFLRAVEGAGLTQQLKGGEDYTIFAPTDDAFGRIPGARRDSLLRDKAALEVLIRNHVVQGRLTADEARRGARGMSFLGGGAIKVDTTGSFVKVNGAQVIKPDLLASNGIIHVVDQVWVPPITIRVMGTTPEDSVRREGANPN